MPLAWTSSRPTQNVRPPFHNGYMASEAVVKAFEAIDAAIAMLHAEVAQSGFGLLSDTDPLAAIADECLDILAGVARTEARVAALKAAGAAKYADSARSAAPPEMPVQAQEMAIAAEVGCVLAIGDGAAGALLAQSYALATSLPRTLAALQAGTVSWQHARVMVDETATLDHVAAGALEAHFLHPDAPNPASGCPAGEMPAYRFRRKARTWRERHHPDSIEKRHIKGAQDRCLEYAPEHDGMARLSAYLPADQAVAIWNRFTAIARGLQGPHEDRTLTQLRADAFAAAALRCHSSCTHPGDSVGGSGTGGKEGHASLADVATPRAEVLVTVPVLSLLGLTEEPAMLDGYGPIPASMARALVANGADSFHRVLVDPRDGRLWKSAGPVTGSQRQCGTGYGCATASARSQVAATIPWTTRQTTSGPGITAEPPKSATWDSYVPSTTGSNTPSAGDRRRQQRMRRPVGSHPQGGNTKANNRIGNRLIGRLHCGREPARATALGPIPLPSPPRVGLRIISRYRARQEKTAFTRTSVEGELPDEPVRSPLPLGSAAPWAPLRHRLSLMLDPHRLSPSQRGPRTRRAESPTIKSRKYCRVLEVPVIILSIDSLTDDVRGARPGEEVVVLISVR